MTRSDSSFQFDPDHAPRSTGGDRTDSTSDLPEDLVDLDRKLADLLAPQDRGEADARTTAMIANILAATTPDLPDLVLPFEATLRERPRRFPRLVAGLGAVAAVLAVAVLAGRLLTGSTGGHPASETTMPRLADASATDPDPTRSVDPIEVFDLVQSRESEVMLVAVLDPADDWFDDDAFADPDAESVLRSRAFGIDDLEGSVFAMLGGSTS
jgi:hypothetical protein